MPNVSVIVPVYNTELYVERAITSLMEQTLSDVEFIIIDDGSKDQSLKIIRQVIARYPKRQNQIILISRENRGVAATRAQGMDLATGNYIIHLDSDDWAAPNWLEVMYTKAIEDNADVVICDFTAVYTNESIHIKQPVAENGTDCVSKLLTGSLHGSCWNKLIKRQLLVEKKLNFQSGINYLEDFILITQVILASRVIRHIDKALINYNQTNTSSITSTINESTVKQIIAATDIIASILKHQDTNKQLHEYLYFFKLNQKYWMLYCNRKNVPAYLWTIFSEADKFILKSQLPFYAKIILLLGTFRLSHIAEKAMRLTELLKKAIT